MISISTVILAVMYINRIFIISISIIIMILMMMMMIVIMFIIISIIIIIIIIVIVFFIIQVAPLVPYGVPAASAVHAPRLPRLAPAARPSLFIIIIVLFYF